MQGVYNIGYASIAKPHSKALIQGFIINFFELQMERRLACTGARN